MQKTGLLFSTALILALGFASPSHALFGLGDSNVKLKALYEMQETLNKLQTIVEKSNKKINAIESHKEFLQPTLDEINELEKIIEKAKEEIQAPTEADISKLQQDLKAKGENIKQQELLIKYDRENITLVDDLMDIIRKKQKVSRQILQSVKSDVWDETLDTQINKLKIEIDDVSVKLQQKLKVYRQLLQSNEYFKKRVQVGKEMEEKDVLSVINDLNSAKKAFFIFNEKTTKLKASLKSHADQGEEQIRVLERLAKSAGCALIKNKSQVNQSNIKSCMLIELKKKKIDVLKRNEVCAHQVLKQTNKGSSQKTNNISYVLDENASYLNITGCAASLLGKPLLPGPKEAIKPSL